MAVGYENTTDPRKVAANNRALVQQRGDQLMQDEGGRAGQAGDERGRYSGYLDDAYAPMAQGNGGYNDAERQGILREGEMQGYMATPEELQSNYLTGDEQAGIMGDTGSYTRDFDPDAMSQEQEVSAGRQRQAVSDLQQGVNAAVNPDRLRQADAYRQDSENQLSANKGEFGTVAGAMANNVRGAIDPSAVTASDSFLKDYNMSPEEQQNLVTSAGISAGAKDSAAVGDLERRAAAAGAGPMGIGAYRARMARQQAGDAGDAMTKARVDTSNAAAGRKMAGEQLREQGGQYLTGVRTGTELQMGEDALRGTQQLGDQALQQRNTVEGNRQGAEQFTTDAQMKAATTGGQAEIGNEANINTQGRQQQQFNTTTGTGIAQAQDTANSYRSGQVANNRQAVSTGNQATKFGQGTTVSNTDSARQKTVADARTAAQDKGLGYYQNQQGQANQNQQNSYGRQGSLYSTQAGAGNQATNTTVAASQTPSTFDKVMGGVSGAVGTAGKVLALADGGVVTEPTLGIVGEQGPEKVIPLGSRISNAFKQIPSQMKQNFQQSNLGQALRGDPMMSKTDPQKSNPGAYGPSTGGSYNFPQPDAPPANDYMSEGQTVTKPTLTMLGADGPEAVIPMSGYRARQKTRPSLAQPSMRQPYGQQQVA